MKMSSDAETEMIQVIMQNPLDFGMSYSIWDEDNIKRYVTKKYQVAITTNKARNMLSKAWGQNAQFTVYGSVNEFKNMLNTLGEDKCVYCFHKYLGKYKSDTAKRSENGLKLIQLTEPTRYHFGFFYFNQCELVAYDYATGTSRLVRDIEWGKVLPSVVKEFSHYDYFVLPYSCQTISIVKLLSKKQLSTKFIMIPHSIYMKTIADVLLNEVNRLYSGIGQASKHQDPQRYVDKAMPTPPYYFNVSSKKALSNRLEILVNEYNEKTD